MATETHRQWRHAHHGNLLNDALPHHIERRSMW